ncbi:hypothetical protein A3Q56_00059 [Intoshia linei]|uniref:C2H2-type domain-containing protein n=1 Tax=Intoshia linei TaxID=1819745 RepID=A0A177BD04_9BILA|nr:hypothetical protein A3Q56_00059 [Intoshia linei]
MNTCSVKENHTILNQVGESNDKIQSFSQKLKKMEISNTQCLKKMIVDPLVWKNQKNRIKYVKKCSTSPKIIKIKSKEKKLKLTLFARSLTLNHIVKIIQNYKINGIGLCPVCNKMYKSRVCFVKHLWEHTVYWDMFDGEKCHDRVLAIQAAIILHIITRGDDQNLSLLLVTFPNCNSENTK